MNKTLSLKVQILYGLGVSYAIVDQIFAQWILYFYLPPASSGLKALLTPALLAFALAISRVVDVITDPLIGYLSDKSTSKYGRRIPFIAVGTIPLAITTVLFFYPPTSSHLETFIYLTLIGGLFFTFYTIVGGPYNSLIPEIGHTSEDRLKLSTWQSVFRLLYSAIAMIVPGILIKYFGGSDTVKGVRYMVIALSILFLIGSFATVFGVKESDFAEKVKSDITFKKAVSVAFNNKYFINYLLGMMFFFVGFNTLRAVMNYYIQDIMGYGTKEITLASAILFGVSALFFFPVAKLSKKHGYKKMMKISLILLTVLSFGIYGIGKFFPVNIGFVVFALLGIPISGAAFIFPPAMLSDISARIGSESGEHIEGICFGIQGFFLKMAFLISIFVLPFLLSLFNNGVVGEFGIRITAIFSLVAFVISYFFYSRYEELRNI